MGKLERLAAARERVRKWKASHPKSVEWQRKRWYARKKEWRAVRVKEAVKRAGEVVEIIPSYGELHYEDMATVEGERQVVFDHARAMNRRTGRAIPEHLMEPRERGGPKYGRIEGMGQGDERGVSSQDGSGPEQRSTGNEAATYARFEEFKERKARGAQGRSGVAVGEIVV